MFHGTYTLTATQEASAILLVKFLRGVLWRGESMAIGEVLPMARLIQDGPFEIESDRFMYDLESNELLTVTKVAAPDPWKALFARMEECHNLLERGAAGDAEAAMEYCRRELAGEVPHGPIG